MASKKHSFLMKLTAITLVACILFINTACKDLFKSSHLIPPGEEGHYSEEELTELYYANADAFLAAANAVLESEELFAYMKEIAEADFDIRMHVDKRYFSDEDWAAITEIFEIARPIMLMRCCKKANVAYFVFPKNSQTNTSVTLYYFPNPTDELVEFYAGSLYPVRYTEKYYPIDENWWIIVSVEL